MNEKIVKVYYGTDRQPYRDIAHTIPFTKLGEENQGGNNATELWINVANLQNAYSVIAQTKLPNGTLIYDLLTETIEDDALFYVLSLGATYTSLEGKLVIAISIYDAQAYVEDDEIVFIGTPHLLVNNNFSVVINYSPITLPNLASLTPNIVEQILALINTTNSNLNTKVDIESKIYPHVLEEVPVVLDDYLVGTILMVKASDSVLIKFYEVIEIEEVLTTREIIADKASKDGDGNSIVATYSTKSELDAEIAKLVDGTYTAKKAERDASNNVITATYGNYLAFSYSNSTRVLTISLYSKDDTLLDTKTITMPLSSGTIAGLMSSTHYTKLDELPTNAELEIALGLKADQATTYTKDETDDLLDNKADLVDGKVPASQLPSFVDDVINAYIVGATAFASDWLSLTVGGDALTPEEGKIYTIITAGDYHNNTYRWSGIQYVNSGSNLALGETSTTAHRGDRGKAAYDHSQVVSGNPHNVTKNDVGLGNVDNTSDVNKPVSTATHTELDKKAKIDGYYAQLHSGLADNLASPDGVTDTDGYAFRTSAGSQSITDGFANLEKVQGNTIVWNQLISNLASASNYGITVTKNANNSLTLSGTITGVTGVQTINVGTIAALVGGRKYAFVANVVSGSITYFNIRGGSLSSVLENTIQTASSNYATQNLQISVSESNNGQTISCTLFINCHGLTMMFGAGNEPATIADFKTMFSLNYYAYNIGTHKNVDIDGIKTVGFNLFNGTYAHVVKGVKVNVAGTYSSVEFALTESGTKTAISLTAETINEVACHTYTPPYSGYLFVNGSDATTCVSNVWSGYRVGDFEAYWTETRAIDSSAYFADGMNGVGSVRDELYKDKCIRKFAKVDLGTLTWGIAGAGTENEITTSSGIASLIKIPSGSTIMASISSTKYVNDTNAHVYNHYQDKTISVQTPNGTVEIYDSALIGKTGAEVKTALSGVYLIYELATYVETAISPELTLSYKVSDFGTEEWLQTAVPAIYVNHETFYMSNLRDMIRRLPLDYYDKEEVDDLVTPKANATQPAWTEMTLLNGYTGYVKVRRNTIGQVECQVSLTVPNPYQAQPICVLTEAFRPTNDETRQFRRSAGGDLIVWISASAGTFNGFSSSTADATIKGSTIWL